MSTLREQLEKLIEFEPGRRGVGYFKADEVRAILSRHADEVTVLRGVVKRIRDNADIVADELAEYGDSTQTNTRDIVRYCDAILGETK
jgi:hypothetical protein